MLSMFGGKKTINVSSVLYNMAGPEEDRTDYLKGTLFSAVLEDVPSLGESIDRSYREGPGIKLRQFYNYAVQKDLEGLPEARIGGSTAVDHATVQGEITPSVSPAGLDVVVSKAFIADGDFEAWIRQWVLDNHPTRIAEDWVGDYDPTTDEFSVMFPNGDNYQWDNNISPVYDRGSAYVCAYYYETLDDNTQALVEGTPSSVTSMEDLTGYSLESSTGTVNPVTLQRERTTIWTYSDATPDFTYEDAVDADVSADLNESVDVYERSLAVGLNGLETEGLFERYTYTGTDSVVGGYSDVVVTETDLGGGVTRTETSTTTGEQVSVSWDEQYDTQVIYYGSVIGNEKVFIYEVGGANATLNALYAEEDASGIQEFFPILPLRIDNAPLDHATYTGNGLYEETKKAYRRATNLKSIDTVLDDIADNPDIGDIDYAYIHYGCALNVQENAAKKYIYEFMSRLIPYQNSNGTTISDFEDRITDYNSEKSTYESWLTAMDGSGGSSITTLTPRPPEPELQLPPISSFVLQADSTLMPSYDFRVNWVHIEDTNTAGVFVRTDLAGSPNAVKGDVMIKKGTAITWTESFRYAGDEDEDEDARKLPVVEIYYQISDSSYQLMKVYGMTHYNFVYGGKAVAINSDEALDDADVSGFIIPLHYPTMIELGIVDYTQLSTACQHIIFNSYEVVKQKWYENILFQILILVALIVIAVVIAPGAFIPGSASIFSGTATFSLVASVVTKYLASIIISYALKYVAIELFGPKWGALFAALLSFAMGAIGSGIDVFSAKGLLQLGSALANGYSGWVQGDIVEMQDELKEFEKEYEKNMKRIDDMINYYGLNNGLNFNPLFLTDSVYGNERRKEQNRFNYLPETTDEFIRRTTMVGSDVVDLSLGMVNDFNEINTSLPRN